MMIIKLGLLQAYLWLKEMVLNHKKQHQEVQRRLGRQNARA